MICPFCAIDAPVLQNNLAVAVFDRYPVNPGHLIPCYRDDVDEPRGGVRGVIPARQSYPTEEP